MASTAAPRHQFASASLYAGDLHPDVTEAVLYEFFNSVGPVASIRICRDSTTRKSLGYAYVNYHSIADAERALDNLNYTSIKGTPCRIMWCHRDPALRKSGAGNLFIKNLDKTLDNKALYDSFSFFGNILSCKVATDESGKSRGFGFVHFESEDAARLAIDRVNNVKLGSKVVYVGLFKKRTERTSDKEARFTNLYVKNFPAAWTEDTLRSVFSPYGDITSVYMAEDKKGRKFGFVNFETTEMAMHAIEQLHARKTSDTGVLPKEEAGSSTAATAASTSPPEQQPAGEGASITDAKAVDTATPAAASESGAPGEPKATETNEASRSHSASTAGTTSELDGLLYVQRAQSRTERNSLLRSNFEQTSQNVRQKYEGVNLYIKNLGENITDASLRKMFEEFGIITSAKVMTDVTGKCKGFGFVCFSNSDEATRAISEMHLKSVGQKPLYVGLAEKRAQRIARLQQRYRNSQYRTGFGGHPMHQTQMPNYGGVGGSVGYLPGPMGNNMIMPGHPGLMWQGGNAPPTGFEQSGPSSGGVMNWRANPPMNQGPAAYGQGGGPGAGSLMHLSRPGGVAPPRRFTAQGQVNSGGVPMTMTNPAGYVGNAPPAAASNAIYGMAPQNYRSPQMAQMVQTQQHKQILGERLFPMIAKHEPNLAGKITGMMLEMENQELLRLIENEARLKDKIQEALSVLEHARRQEHAA